MDNVKVNDVYQKLLDTATVNPEELSEDNKLTDDQVQKISDKIEEISKDNDVLNIVSSLPSNNGVTEAPVNVFADQSDVEVKDVIVSVDPNTGANNVVDNAEDEEIPEVDLNDYLDMAAYESGTMDLDNVEISESIRKEYDLSDQDCVNLIKLLKRVQAKEEDIPYYNELPEGIKKFVDTMCMAEGVLNKPGKNATAKTVIDMLFHEIGADLFSIDINNVINNEIKKSGVDLSAIYEDMIVGKKDKLLEAASKSEEEGNAEAAKTLRDMANACEESYMMSEFIEAIDKHAIRLKRFDMEKPQKVVNSFCDQYRESKMSINNVWDLTVCIPRHLAVSSIEINPEEITMDTIRAFVLLFCKYCQNKKNTVATDHIFMYYFIKNILYLDALPSDATVSKFGQDLIDRIVSTLKLVHERYGY